MNGIKTNPFDNLPVEIIVQVLSNLNGAKIAKCSEVCELWREIIHASKPLQGEIEHAKILSTKVTVFEKKIGKISLER